MELRHLRAFVAVAEEGGFTRAAERLLLAQPGVSALVRRLERELGQDLLDRSGHGVRLTAAGEAALPYARAALAAADGARDAVADVAGLVRGHIAVGMITACTSVELTDLLATFHRRHPGVDITLSEAPAAALADDLRKGRLDAAWIAAAGEPAPGLETRLIAEEELVAAVAPGDPLADRRGVALTALRERPLICLPQGSGIRAALEAACAAAGFAPRVALEASALPIVAELAGRGLGVGIVPASVASAEPGVRALPITGRRLRGRVELAWRAGGPASPAARAFVSHAVAALAAAKRAAA